MSFKLERASEIPLYRQLAGGVIERVGKGLLLPGEALPGTRALANSLGVHRNTVKAAYDELLAAGWVSTSPSRGTFVAAGAGSRRGVTDASREMLGQTGAARLYGAGNGKAASTPAGKASAPAQLAYRRCLVCTDGLPDPRLAPTPELARAIRRELRSLRTWKEADPRGNAGLRACMAERLRSNRGIPASPEEVLIAGSRQLGLYVIARTLFPEGSAIAVEQPGNKAACETFARCGMRVVGVPVDAEGIRTDWLDRCAGLSAVYVTPARQYPTTVAMSAERRQRLLDWSRRSGALIIEDEHDGQFEFEGTPMLPVAAMEARGGVIHIGSVSPIFAPTVEPVYMRATRTAIERLGRMRAAIGADRDGLMEAALFDLIADGTVRRHVRRARAIYKERRDHLELCLREQFGGELHICIPAGGLAIWIEPAEEIDTCSWAEMGKRMGIRFSPSSEYRLDASPHGGMRIGFASFSIEEIATAAAMLKRCRPDGKPEFLAEIQRDRSQFRRCIA